MVRVCVFCGAPADTAEHVWPAWARPLIEAREHTRIHPYHRFVVQDDHEDEHDTWDQPANSMTAKVVCASCNNGWMSDLEGAAKPMLEPMLGDHGRLLHQGGQETLAAWALKTAMMVDQTNTPRRRVIGPDEYRHLHENGRPSSRIRIWLASYTGRSYITLGGTWGIDADKDASDPDRGQRDMWAATILMGAGVFQIFGTHITPLLDDVDAGAPWVHRIWPYVGSHTWNHQPSLDDQTLWVFAEGLLHQLRQLSGG
jgi:hypothetical protein